MVPYILEAGSEQRKARAWIEANVPTAIFTAGYHSVTLAGKLVEGCIIVELPQGSIGRVRREGGFNPIKLPKDQHYVKQPKIEEAAAGSIEEAEAEATAEPRDAVAAVIEQEPQEPHAVDVLIEQEPSEREDIAVVIEDGNQEPRGVEQEIEDEEREPEAIAVVTEDEKPKTGFEGWTLQRSNSRAMLSEEDRRVVRRGAASWQAMEAAATWEKWTQEIGPAIERLYRIAIDEKQFKALLIEHGFKRLTDRKSGGAADLSYLRRAMEKLDRINEWIATCTAEERASWNHPRVILKHWVDAHKVEQPEREDDGDVSAVEQLSPRQTREELLKQQEANAALVEKLETANERLRSRDEEIVILEADKRKLAEKKLFDPAEDDDDILDRLHANVLLLVSRERARGLVVKLLARLKSKTIEEEALA